MEVKFTKEYLEARQEYFDAIDKFFANQDFNNLMGLVPSIYKMFTAKHQEGALAELKKKGFSKEAGDLQSSLRNILENYWKQRKNDELVVWYLIKILSNDFRNDQYFKKTQELYLTIEKLRSDSISKIYPDKFYDSEAKKEKNSEELKKDDNENIKKFDENYEEYQNQYESKKTNKRKKTGLIVGLLLLVLVLAGIGISLFYLFTPAKMDDADTGIVVEVTPENKLEKIGGYEVLVEEVQEDTQKDRLIKTAFGKGLSNYKAYDISLAQGDKEYSFAGEAKLRFPRPESVSKEKVAVYWVSNEGKIEEYQTNYVAATDTISIVTTHFSVFVVTEKPCVVTFVNEGEVVSEQRVTWGNYASIPETTPTKEGYTFLGWYLNGEEWNESASIHQDVTIEAKWKGNEYTVTLDANEGTVRERSVVVTYGENTVFEEAQRTGYEFLGWYEEDQKFESGVWKTARNVTLTAKWKIQEYSIRYELSGGRNHYNNPSSYTMLSETIALNDATNVGYSFGGWYSDNRFTGRVNHISSGSTGDLILFAKWIPNEYIVTLDANEGTVRERSVVVTYGENTVLEEAQRTGYEFLGWYEGNQKFENGKWTTARDVDLTAKWKLQVYSIVYELNGGRNHYNNPSSYTMLSETIVLKEPSKTGYMFEGWYADERYVQRTTQLSTGSVGTVIFYAKWKAENYSVSFDANGGTVSSGSKVVTFDSTYGLLPTPSPYREDGYTVTFNGWYTEKYGGTRVTEETKVTATKDHTLYAEWTVTAKSYTVSFDAADGSTNAKNLQVTFGTRYGTLPIAAKEGYSFAGWFTEREGGTKIESTTTMDKSSNHTLYAHFTIAKYTINYDINDRSALSGRVTVKSGSIDRTLVEYNQRIELPQLTCDYYAFKGWLIAGTLYTNMMKVAYYGSNINSISATAQWEKETDFIEVKTAEELNNIHKNINGTYVLMNNINLKGASWTSIDTFKGILDGNNKSISNFKIFQEKQSTSAFTTLSLNVGFVVKNVGTIKNLTLKEAEITATLTGHQENIVSISGIAVSNSGTISSCMLEEVSIVGTIYPQNDVGGAIEGTLKIGGISADNSGTIRDSKISACYIVGQIEPKESSGTESDGFLGGIAAQNNGTIYSCSVTNNSILRLKVEGETGTDPTFKMDYSTVSATFGGIVGKQFSNGSVKNCTITSGDYQCEISKGGKVVPTQLCGILVGENLNGTLSAETCTYAGCYIQTIQTDETNPSKSDVSYCYDP